MYISLFELNHLYLDASTSFWIFRVTVLHLPEDHHSVECMEMVLNK